MQTETPRSASPPANIAPAARPRALPFVLAALALAFGVTLYDLFRFASGSDLFSYILLIPCVSAYLAWNVRTTRTVAGGETPRRLANVLLALGLGAFAIALYARSAGWLPELQDRLALETAAFLVTLYGTLAWFNSGTALRPFVFPLGFLLFMVPLPVGAVHGIETFMQHGSAAVSRVFFELGGTPVFYQDLKFQLPGIALHVAPECSGIRSTLVLFIVSVLTGYFFLRSNSRRTLLTLATIPLALVRNGFRIFVIGEMCVRLGPEMIDSFVHRRGGPIFFGLSLIPLFLFLLLLQRTENKVARK